MAVHHFDAFQKEMAGQSPKNPAISFQANTVTVITRSFFPNVLAILLLLFLIGLSIINWVWLIGLILILPVCLVNFYSQFIGIGILEIDFFMETVRIRNSYTFLNWMRKIFRVQSEFSFSSIIYIGHKHGPFLDRIGRSVSERSLLFFETDSDWEIFAGQFENEEEAERFVQLLRKFLPYKEEIKA
jgi:hypothetical protein